MCQSAQSAYFALDLCYFCFVRWRLLFNYDGTNYLSGEVSLVEGCVGWGGVGVGGRQNESCSESSGESNGEVPRADMV